MSHGWWAHPDHSNVQFLWSSVTTAFVITSDSLDVGVGFAWNHTVAILNL
jgi:hypothetical protein